MAYSIQIKSSLINLTLPLAQIESVLRSSQENRIIALVSRFLGCNLAADKQITATSIVNSELNLESEGRDFQEYRESVDRRQTHNTVLKMGTTNADS